MSGKHNQETRRKMSESQKARWQRMSIEDRMIIATKIRQNAVAKRELKKKLK